MRHQHLCTSRGDRYGIMFMNTADFYYPDWGCMFGFFLQSGIEKLHAWQGIEPTTLHLRSKSGAYDLSSSANKL